MYATIIPFGRSLGTKPLLYETRGEYLVSGSIVTIPYGKDEDKGMVTALYQQDEIDITVIPDIRTIVAVVTHQSLLATYQIRMIERISERYMIPIHRVLGIFLPRPVLKRLEKKNYEVLKEGNEIGEKGDTECGIEIVQNGIVTPLQVAGYLCPSTIVILPDDFSLAQYESFFSYREDIFFVPNDTTDTKRAQSWIDIHNGKYPIIVGTRRLLYYNLSRYQHILYIEDALGGDYWHYPIRIQYIDILRILDQSILRTDIKIITSIPALTTLAYFQHYPIRNISTLPI